MTSVPARLIWDQAANRLQDILIRKEDKLTHQECLSMCQQNKKAIIDFLKSYLVSNGVKPHPVETVYILAEQCKEIDDRFYSLDLSSVNCRFEQNTTDFCDENHRLNHCMKVAMEVRDLTEIPNTGDVVY